VSPVTVPSWPETFFALLSAETADELWTVLEVPHGIRSLSGWDDPFEIRWERVVRWFRSGW
jgi:hypothetical protein